MTSVGKSTFIDRLKSAELRQRFGIPDGYIAITPISGLDTLVTGPINILVFHYDLLRPFGRPVQSHGRDPALHLLSSAEKITVITLFNSAEELVKRKSKSETTIDPASRHRILLKMYRNSEFLDSWYEAWFDEMQKYASSTVSSLHVRTNDNYDIVADHNEFRRILHQGADANSAPTELIRDFFDSREHG